MAPVPDPYDRIVAAIAQGFKDQKAQQAATGIHFDPAGLRQFQSMMSDAVQEGTSRTAVSGGRGAVPKIGPAPPRQAANLPTTGQPPRVMPHSYKWEEKGITGIVQATSTFFSHRIAQRTQTTVAAAHEQTRKGLQAKMDQRGKGYQVGDYDQDTGKFNVQNAKGESLGQIAPSDSLVDVSMQYQRGALASGALAGLGSGQGMFAGMAEGAMMAGMPELAVAIPAIKAIADSAKEMVQLPEQLRSAGQQYQSIYGGSMWGGLGQQAQGGLFGLSEMFNLGFGQGQEAFQGVSQLGIQGGGRQNMLNFIIGQYDNLGVSVKQSLALVQQAAEQGNQELTGLAKSIDTVTTAARNSGVNAAQSRQNFQTQVGALFNQGVVQNPTSQAIAAANTAYQAGGGQLFQGQSFAGLNSQNAMMAMAGTQGVSVETVQGLAMSQGGSQAYVRLQGQAFNTIAGPFINQVLPIVQRYVPTWQRLKVKITGNSPDITNIISQMAQSDSSGAWLQGCQNAVMQFTGQQMPMDVSAAMVVMQAIQIAWPQSGIGLGAQQTQASPPQQLSQAQTRSLGKDITNWTSFNTVGSTNNAALNQLYKSAGITTHGISGDVTNAQGQYLQSVVRSGGETNPALAALASNADLSKQKFLVNTTQGQRMVNYSDLAKYYGDQAAAGQVTIATGTDAGQTIQQATGTQAVAGQTTPSSRMSPQGHTSAPPAGTGSFTGTITIQPTQQLQQLLSFSSPDMNIASANAANLPVTPYSTPTANPATTGSSG